MNSLLPAQSLLQAWVWERYCPSPTSLHFTWITGSMCCVSLLV